MKEKLKSVKTDSSLFIHHSSFSHRLGFALRKVSFDRAKDHVSSHTTKHNLSRDETLPLANLDFVNREITEE